VSSDAPLPGRCITWHARDSLSEVHTGTCRGHALTCLCLDLPCSYLFWPRLPASGLGSATDAGVACGAAVAAVASLAQMQPQLHVQPLCVALLVVHTLPVETCVVVNLRM
jgi:hypothetical protein